MGTDTKAYFPGTTRDQIIEFLGKIAAVGKARSTDWKEYVTLDFRYKDESRTIHLHDTKIDQATDTKKWKSKDNDSVSHVSQGLPDNTQGTYASFGYWGSSVEIMKILCYMFGGYIDEQDTDNKDFGLVPKKTPRAIIRLLFKHK